MKKQYPVTPADRVALKELIAAESSYPISDKLLDRFIDSGHIEVYGKKEAIMAAGSVYSRVGIVLEGITRIWRWDNDTEKTDYFGLPGTLCMSIHGFVFNLPAVTFCETCCFTRMFIINRPEYNRLVDESHEFAKWALGNAYMQLYGFEHKQRIINGTALERYEALLHNRPEIMQNVPLKTIASYLGITPQYLSKLRRRSK